ncbi:MAG TPA: ABC transporter permease [Chlamydiales bacterium]|nr:ABC transporter permease [Chlamydiales bacterium]
MNSKRLYALIIKEFLAVWQDKKSRLVLILPPLIQLFLFAFAATLDVTNISMVILNRDYGKQAYELTQRFQGAPYFKHIRYVNSLDEIQKAIDNQEAMAALHIDEQFSKQLLSGNEAKVQLILDGRKSNTAQIIQGYANRIILRYYYDFAKEMKPVQQNLPIPTTEIISRNWFNPNLVYTWFTVPGLVAVLTMVISLLVSALSVARERELGTFDQLLVSPLTPVAILIGKTIPGLVISMIEGTLILIIAIFFFGIPFTGSIIALYFAMIFFILSIIGIGLFISSLCSTQQQALLGAFVFMVTAVILSGFATPIDNMPLWLQKMTVINPLKYFLIICRALFLKAMPIRLVLQNLIPITICAFINLFIAQWFFKKRLE